MKKMKKITCLLLAMLMMFAMSMSALAATVTIDVIGNNGVLDGHSFKAYQVFKGTQASSSDNDSYPALGDAEWGNGINGTAFLTDLIADSVTGTTFSGCSTALDVAKKLDGMTNDSVVAKRVAKIAYKNITGTGYSLSAGENVLDSGYYLIVDTTAIGANDDNAYNAALLQVTNEITINVKTDKPSVEKKVYENVKSVTDGKTGEAGTKYNDVADYSIGDVVPFAFYSNVPDMTYYDTYKYVFHDQMSAGLTLDENSIKVSINGFALTLGTDYTVARSGNGDTFTITISDLKRIASATTGAELRVDYNATLNSNAVIGLPGNENKVRLEYSNNPNKSGIGTPEDPHTTGTTPWDNVIVFTYGLNPYKVDGTDNTKMLKDAEFKLYRGLAASPEYAKVSNGIVTGWTADEAQATILRSDDNGAFKVSGLDDGTYYLKETKAPAGYNILKDAIEVTISAATANNQSWTGTDPRTALTGITITNATVTDTVAVDDYEAVIKIANNKGAVLPTTGGMGTTLFYVVGGLLVVGATVLLITKRRMDRER